ncbi:MAG TPA: chorismate-binding protein, partial [Vicinamibacteria bacterium]|nr:chorismate-binding protein [Vicinamibacteria bacterium]
MKSLAFDDYDRLSAGGGPVPVFREVPGDTLTPVSAFLALSARSERAFLLESVLGGERLARYSFLGRDPLATLEVRGDEVLVREGGTEKVDPRGLFAALRARLGAPPAEIPGLPRFTGGAVGYLSYDAVRLFERIPDRHGPADVPLASFAFYRSLVAFDHVQQRLVLIVDTEPGSRRAFAQAQEVLDGLEEDLRWQRRPGAEPSAGGPPQPASLSDGASFRDAVERAKEYIAAGDIFQVVLSRQQTVPCALDPFRVYRALRMVNPSPYMYFLKDRETTVAGASPEMLVRVEGRQVETRPIAGTRPRGDSEARDEALARELLADEKERAEHIML